MKKIVTMLLAFVMVMALASCGAKPAGENEISRLFAEGYQCTMSGSDEHSWKGIFEKEDAPETAYLVMATMTSKAHKALDKISFGDEESEQEYRAILGSLPNVTVTDISDQIPSQEELNAYVGKTLGDLEDDGFVNCGDFQDGDVCLFNYEGPTYSCNVYPEDGAINMADYSPNDLRTLKIGKIEFSGFSLSIFDAN